MPQKSSPITKCKLNQGYITKVQLQQVNVEF